MDEFLMSIKYNMIKEELISDVDDNTFFSNISKLKCLHLYTSTPFHYIKDLKYVKSIEIINSDIYNSDDWCDYSELKYYTNIRDLIIVNNKSVKSLNLTGLNNLKNLIIISNSSLEHIYGLEKLTNLNCVILVGNRIKNIQGFDNYLNNTRRCVINKLDVNMYHYLFGGNTNQHYDKGTVEFAEKISVGEIFNLNFEMMRTMCDGVKKIISKIINNNDNEALKIFSIYKYIISSLSYDYYGLQNRNLYLYGNNNISIYTNEYKGMNSSYVAFFDHKVVCEGYTNLFKFMLNVIGIDCEIIHCIVKENNKDNDYFNYSACRVKFNDIWYYCDPQKENDSNNLKYYMKTLSEFEVTHVLPNSEYKIAKSNRSKNK